VKLTRLAHSSRPILSVLALLAVAAAALAVKADHPVVARAYCTNPPCSNPSPRPVPSPVPSPRPSFKVLVPYLIGEFLPDAGNTLRGASLQVGTVSGGSGSSLKVDSQDLPAGTQVDNNTPVNLHVVAAPAPGPIPAGYFNGLRNPSFESGTTDGWDAVNLAQSVNHSVYGNSSVAQDGYWYMEMNTSQGGGSVAQDSLNRPYWGGSYTFTLWLRSPDGTPFSGRLQLWGLDGFQEAGYTDFTVGPGWSYVTATLTPQYSNHTFLRAEIYMFTTGHNLDIDNAQLPISYSPPPELRTVPFVVGMNLNDAGSTIQNYGFQVGSVTGSTMPCGQVSSQSPTGGTGAPLNSAVSLHVNTPRTVAVPVLVGKSLSDAANLLPSVGLTEGALAGDKGFNGLMVIGQDPPAGTKLCPGSPVNLQVRATGSGGLGLHSLTFYNCSPDPVHIWVFDRTTQTWQDLRPDTSLASSNPCPGGDSIAFTPTGNHWYDIEAVDQAWCTDKTNPSCVRWQTSGPILGNDNNGATVGVQVT
jgi:beta-lactam-binding protein with PASTA domain